MLPYVMDAGAQRRLEAYLNEIGDVLGDARRRASFATYAMGLWGDGERKSVEPIAARACADPDRTDAEHQRLLHFVSNSPWSDQEVRGVAARYGVEAMATRERILGWIIDDTGFLKQGTHSVRVQPTSPSCAAHRRPRKNPARRQPTTPGRSAAADVCPLHDGKGRLPPSARADSALAPLRAESRVRSSVIVAERRRRSSTSPYDRFSGE